MKCVCGYEHESGIDDNGVWQKNLIGDESFVVSETELKFNLSIRESVYSNVYKKIYVCPKCGTLKIDL